MVLTYLFATVIVDDGITLLNDPFGLDKLFESSKLLESGRWFHLEKIFKPGALGQRPHAPGFLKSFRPRTLV